MKFGSLRAPVDDLDTNADVFSVDFAYSTNTSK